MTRESILNRAIECVCGKREQDYGSPEDNFELIAELWESYISKRCMPPNTGACVLPEDVAAMMALLKIARIGTGTATDDSWVDLAGYAACGGEMAAAEADRRKNDDIKQKMEEMHERLAQARAEGASIGELWKYEAE